MNVPATKFSKLLRRWKLILAITAGIFVGYVLRWGLAPAQMAHTEHIVTAPQPQEHEAAALWTCSMHPQIRMPKPGLCPICNMKLIAVRRQEDDMTGGMREFTTSEYAKALMDIETSAVERKFVTAEIRMVGKVEYDETRFGYITAWVPGRLDRLYVDYTGISVRKGQHMVDLYSPELLSAQEELIQAIDAVRSISAGTSAIVREVTLGTQQAAREKLRLLGLTAEQVSEIERSRTVSEHITIYSPASGTVIHKNAQEGMYVDTGTRIYTVADLTHVWVKLDAYESELQWLRYGQDVEFTTVSYPGRVFTGSISFIDPVLSAVTRTIKIRVNVPNPDGTLKPEMFVKAVVKTQIAAGGKVMDPKVAGKWICPMHPSIIKNKPGICDICEMPLVGTESLGYVSADSDISEKPLVIPASAALVTGTRAIVYVELTDRDKPTYEGREIVLGPRAGNYYIVHSGLKEGERVVTKGNFKIDSALQIQARPSMMSPEGGGPAATHLHGGHAPTPQAATDMPSQTALAAESLKQLNAVLAASQAVRQSFSNQDVPQIRLAFTELEKAVKDVDMKLLQGHFHILWMEISMRLNNDCFEGKHARTMPEALRINESLKANIDSLKSNFGLVHAPLKGLSKPLILPAND
ncbi:MAG TPA: efflux RND transporter periplasmic adaptor subunit [Sedimentisphaerales bacterium]|nr:efflux RND transporter periplasmic adaptor subunit [Sedimentisphaerales bacterium]